MVRLLQVGVAAACFASTQAYEKEWQDFKAKYGKSYSDDEEQKRFGIFKSNFDLISLTNAQQQSFTLGVNEFADLTFDEFKVGRMGLRRPRAVWGELPYLGRHNYSGSALPDAVDWVKNGAVTPIKNQGSCGSCWAFSTTGSLEGAWQVATKKLVPLSEQQFVDCDKAQDLGCNGGLMDNAFAYAEKNAICTEESYSYKGHDSTCSASGCTVGIPKGGVQGFKDVNKGDTNALKDAVAQGPVSVAIEADSLFFQMYSGGVMSSNFCGDHLDHGVLVVGYGTDGGKDYWKVKNSWGASWGEHGYIRVIRGTKKTGECGILMGPPSYPVVKSAEIVAETLRKMVATLSAELEELRGERGGGDEALAKSLETQREALAFDGGELEDVPSLASEASAADPIDELFARLDGGDFADGGAQSEKPGGAEPRKPGGAEPDVGDAVLGAALAIASLVCLVVVTRKLNPTLVKRAAVLSAAAIAGILSKFHERDEDR